jgi:membrane protein
MQTMPQFIKESIANLYRGMILFYKKKGTTLASSSSFFLLITIVPFALLMVRGIGYFLGNLDRTQKYIFLIGSRFFPQVAPDLLMKLQHLIKGPLFTGTNFTLLNFIFLAVTIITFLNSIWVGIFFITDDKSVLSLWRILKGFVIIAMTLLMLSLVFILPPVIIFIIKFMQSNVVIKFFWDNFDSLRPYIKYILKINLRKSYWLNSNILHISILIVYFTYLYRWLFSWKIHLHEAFVAALSFSLSVFLGKSIFWIYIYYVRSSLIRNYGDLYTSVVGVIWIFYLMCFFFYGACVCHVYKERRELRIAK